MGAAGLLHLLMAALNMGIIIRFISDSVLSGFTSAVLSFAGYVTEVEKIFQTAATHTSARRRASSIGRPIWGGFAPPRRRYHASE